MMKLGLFSRKTKNVRKSPCLPSSALSSGAPSDASLVGDAQTFLTSSVFGAVSQQSEGEHDWADDEDDHTFYPSFAEVRRVLISCILATDMELFRHHHEAMRKRGQMKRSTWGYIHIYIRVFGLSFVRCLHDLDVSVESRLFPSVNAVEFNYAQG